MSNDSTIIGPEQLRDQHEKMIEEWGLTEEEADQVFTDVKTHLTLQAQNMDKDWSKETLEEITNLTIAIQHQNRQKRKRRKSYFYNRLYNLLAGAVIAGSTASLTLSLYTGDYVGAATAGITLIALLYIHSRNA